MNNNSDDFLAKATRAMRDNTSPSASVSDLDDEESVVARATLGRIERSSRANRVVTLRKRRFTRWIVMPMAASFVVFCAWASASGRLSQWVGARSIDESTRPEHVTDPVQQSATGTKPAITVAPPPPSASASEAPIEEAPQPAASISATKPVVSAAAPRPDVDALYRDAHDAHFVRKDPAAALTAWDRYLAAAGPSGKFTLEAKYNRAITLVRLGRKSEAAAALRPFANGDYGGYRREEASDLLRTLE